jgi:predicted acyl esterase
MLLDSGRCLLEHDVRVRMGDGVELSLDVYRPPEPGRHPALLEHIPYRKDDLRAETDRGQNIALVRAGLACVRVDVRGSGSSGGVVEDEYTTREQRDGVEVVDWISRQPWCSGSVGAWGKSYGGFSAIQLAANRPPALRAIAPMFATDDRFTDDMHFDGGALCAFELSNYPVRMIAMNALPPSGTRDREFDEAWRERIESTPLWILRWLSEQQDSPYWRNGSLRPDYERIEVPVFMTAGWRDGYRTAAVRMAQKLRTPFQLLAGPWAHFSPDEGVPGPRYPGMAQMIDFFRGQLTGTAARAWPRTTFFLGTYNDPSRPVGTVPGEWLCSDVWPAGTQESRLVLGGPAVAPASVTVGIATGNWCPPPPEHGQFLDQRIDEAKSAVFTSEPLAQDVFVFGQPIASFSVRTSEPKAIVSIKLSAVGADGRSQYVTRGVVRPDGVGVTEVSVPLMATAWRFRTGESVRISVAANDWPCLWPLPRVSPLEITSPVELTFPGLPNDARPAEPSEAVTPLGFEGSTVRSSPARWDVVVNSMTGEHGIAASDRHEFAIPEEGLMCRETHHYRTRAIENDPLSARVIGSTMFELSRPGLEVRSHAEARYSATAEEFICHLRLRVSADGKPFAERRVRERVPRVSC